MKEAIAITQHEFSKLANSDTYTEFGMNPWYINEGGDPNNLIYTQKQGANRLGISDQEYERRKISVSDSCYIRLPDKEEENSPKQFIIEGCVEFGWGNIFINNEDFYDILKRASLEGKEVKITVEF